MVALIAACATACSEAPSYYPGTRAEWQQDAALVDSLSYLVPTDSLYRAYHASLEARDLQAAHQEIACIEIELRLRHGTYPAVLAIDRMKDTLWAEADQPRVLAHDQRLPPAMEMGSTQCGFPDSLWAAKRALPWALNHVDPRHRPRHWGK